MKQFLSLRGAERTTRPGKSLKAAVPLLQNGDCLTQPEFHRRYEAYPDDTKFELIGGIVYMASPVRWKHGNYDGAFGLLFCHYTMATCGTQMSHNATAILGELSEPQPDSTLLILNEFGGQTRFDDDGYVFGAPELLAETAFSTVSIDMNQKRVEYERAGVIEYIVWCVEEAELHWFDFKSGRKIAADKAGIFRSRVFPGLWINSEALKSSDYAKLLRNLKRGLASPEHARFAKRLQAFNKKLS